MFLEVGKMEIIHLPGYSLSAISQRCHVHRLSLWLTIVVLWRTSTVSLHRAILSLVQHRATASTWKPSARHNTAFVFTWFYMYLSGSMLLAPLLFTYVHQVGFLCLPWSRCQIHGDSEYDIQLLLCFFPFGMFRCWNLDDSSSWPDNIPIIRLPEGSIGCCNVNL